MIILSSNTFFFTVGGKSYPEKYSRHFISDSKYDLQNSQLFKKGTRAFCVQMSFSEHHLYTNTSISLWGLLFSKSFSIATETNEYSNQNKNKVLCSFCFWYIQTLGDLGYNLINNSSLLCQVNIIPVFFPEWRKWDQISIVFLCPRILYGFLLLNSTRPCSNLSKNFECTNRAK